MRWSLIRKRSHGEDPPQEAPRPESLESTKSPKIADQREEFHPLLRLSPPPPVRGLHPFRSGLGIQESAIAREYRVGNAPPPYIPRDVDPWLDEALATSRFVLVTGSSKAGKSRTAFAAATRMEPEPLLIVPASPRAVPELLADGPGAEDGRPSLLWLDGLARYLVVAGVGQALFDNLRAKGPQGKGVVVLATLTLTEYELLLGATGEIGRSLREILGSALQVTVPSGISPAEREFAARLYPEQDFTAGIGQHFASSPELIDRFKASLKADPELSSIVAAALDWRRTGLPRSVTEGELQELSTMYLQRYGALDVEAQQDFASALGRGRERAESNAALLMAGEGGDREAWEINDAVRDWVDGRGPDVDERLRTIPETTWTFVIGRATEDDAFSVGVAARLRGFPGAAVDAWTKAATEASPATSCQARLQLGLVLLDVGRHVQALEAFDGAVHSCAEAAPGDVV
ncbi:MAG: hypothetical protein QOD62_2237, partial [Actinomycetota bacterium]|nr:hypothetical protein [Actinomycetota bacterium]